MLQLLDQITCPNCWAKFKPEEIHWRSEHRDLMGDPLLGENEQLRFLPNRFRFRWQRARLRKEKFAARLHARNATFMCLELRWNVSRFSFQFLVRRPCGNRFYLGALIHELRRNLPARFKISFRDANPAGNQILSDYVENMFLSEQRQEINCTGRLDQENATSWRLVPASQSKRPRR